MSEQDHVLVLSTEAADTIAARLSEASSPGAFFAAADAVISGPDSKFGVLRDLGPSADLSLLGSSGDDIEAAIRIYGHLGRMDRVEATDRRLWNHLAFAEYRTYCASRWAIAKDPGDGDKWKRRVLDRWMMTGPTRGQLVRHAVSRLWWAAFLTHDPDLVHPLAKETGDEWAYLRVLFAKADRALQIMDRDIAMYPGVLMTLLEHLREAGDDMSEDLLRSMMKELTLIAGYRELATLPSSELREMVDDVASRLVST